MNRKLKPRTLLFREMIIILDEYMRQNLMNSGSKSLNRVDINFEGYHKLMPSSCIRNEIRRKFWGIAEPYEPNEPHSICETLTSDQLDIYYTED